MVLHSEMCVKKMCGDQLQVEHGTACSHHAWRSYCDLCFCCSGLVRWS